MDNYFHPVEASFTKRCISRAVGALVPDYIVNLLEDPEVEEVENHLVECCRCQERYLMILDIRAFALQARTIAQARGA